MHSETWYPIILGLVGVFCVLAGWILRWFFANKNLRAAEERAKTLIEFANREAESRKKEAELAAKDMLLKLRQDFEKETKDRRDEIGAAEKRILQKEENLDKRVDLLEKKEKDITTRLTALRQEEETIKAKHDELIDRKSVV